MAPPCSTGEEGTMTTITADDILRAYPTGRITRAMVPNGISWREGIRLSRAARDREQRERQQQTTTK
jgi:hypothetical protein